MFCQFVFIVPPKFWPTWQLPTVLGVGVGGEALTMVSEFFNVAHKTRVSALVEIYSCVVYVYRGKAKSWAY